MIKNIQYKKLGEICDFISGGTPSKSKNEYWKNGNIPWIKISDFKEKYIKCSDEKITKNGLENSSAKLLKKGTILYTIFASVGKVAILDIEATTNQAIVGVNLKENNLVDKDFLYYFLCSIENNIKKQARGVAQNNINISILKNVCIPILPISSQKNIVKTLKRLEDILENFKQKKILINFLNKSLFTTMFGDPLVNDKNEWKFYKIKNVGKIISGSTPSTNISKYWNGEHLWITPAELNDNSFIVNSTERKLTYLGVKNSSLIELPIGTVLLSSRAPIGKVAIVGKKMFCNQGFKNIIPNKEVNSVYLYYILKEKKEYLNFLGRGVTFKELSKEIVENISIKVPPIELQNKFAERVEKIEKLSFEIEEAIKETENLYNSLISKYFD